MKEQISTWEQFGRQIRTRTGPLLAVREGIEQPLMVTGCQRSGTTLLTSLFLRHPEFIDYQVSDDAERDGALYLAGLLPLPKAGRYCLQTTYLNERYPEYLTYPGKIVFLIRSPLSVVYSMCHHWGRRLRLYNFALNEVFTACAPKEQLTAQERFLFSLFGAHGLSSLRKACLAYVGKTSQLFYLQERIPDRLLVVDYDSLVQNRQASLAVIAAFAGIAPDSLDASLIHNQGIKRASALTSRERREIERTCMETYEKAGLLAMKPV